MATGPLVLAMRAAVFGSVGLAALVAALIVYNAGPGSGAILALPLLLAAALAFTWTLPSAHLRPRLRAVAWAMGIVGVGLLSAALLSSSTCTTHLSSSFGPDAASPTPGSMTCTHRGIPPSMIEGAFIAGALALGMVVAAVARARPFARARVEEERIEGRPENG